MKADARMSLPFMLNRRHDSIIENKLSIKTALGKESEHGADGTKSWII